MQNRSLAFSSILFALLTPFARATYIGADPPKCQTCACSCNVASTCQRSDTTSCVSRTEGNLTETIGKLRRHDLHRSYRADGAETNPTTRNPLGAA